ncbi:MAG TPA: phosphopantetheine-binding protein [Candidatus Acidoferrales bacterium]|nr:phosphopantetheine-binding protein [Candidatus Acidoferrales bacterium]
MSEIPSVILSSQRPEQPEPRPTGPSPNWRPFVEDLLASLWCDVFGVKQVSTQDDFFALGGQSILAVQLILKLRDATGCELPVSAIFQFPTIAKLVDAMEQGQLPLDPRTTELLDRIAGLSEEDAEKELASRISGSMDQATHFSK